MDNSDKSLYGKFPLPGGEKISIREIDVSTRLKSVFIIHGYEYLHEILELSAEGIWKLPNMGSRTMRELCEELCRNRLPLPVFYGRSRCPRKSQLTDILIETHRKHIILRR